VSESVVIPSAPGRPLLWLRTLVGLILAPVAGGMVVMLGMVAIDPPGFDDILSALAFGGFYGGILGGLPALLIGWPLHLLLLRQRWTSVWVYVGLGALIGVVGIFVTAPILDAID